MIYDLEINKVIFLGSCQISTKLIDCLKIDKNELIDKNKVKPSHL